MQAHSFRFSFTPLLGVLPTFPSRYWSTIGLRQSLALRDGPRGFGQDSSCPALLRWSPKACPVTRTGLSPSADRLSRRFRFLACSSWKLLQPRTRLDAHGLGSSPFARHYSGNRYFFLLLQVLRCFSSLRSPRSRAARTSCVRVSPFGHLRITSRLRIPGAFRSLPRPSSLPEA